MRAIDTNVLVRLMSGDDSRQVEIAGEFIEGGAWVPLLAIAEASWVLKSFYGRSPHSIAASLDMLLEHEHLMIQDSDTVASAVNLFKSRPALGFSDCLILETTRKAGHLPLGTFDRALARSPGTTLLKK